ncbi:MAG TPA: AMP-binding protein, partial [Candidatus Limnocylindrales bacterium]|nr:AMP-binding protein [Candidatus Limnocylindrales bacterium]
ASFTTGSTGEPKLVVRSHDVLRAQHVALQRLRSLPGDDVDLVGLPALVLHNLAAGVTSVLPSADVGTSRYGATLRETIVRARPTSAVGFPHLFESAAEGADPGAFDSLRAIHVGGSRVKGELVRVLAGLAPGARLGVVYGSTEIEPIAAIEGEPYLDALAGSDAASGVCVGRPVEGLELRLEPDGGDDRPFGERPGGSIVVRGRHAAARPGEWVRTGDVGWVDEDSRLWLLGRAANAVGGVRPFEVELALERLDWVRHASLTRVGEAGTPRLALAVEPRDRGGASRARQVADVRDLIAEHGWPVDEVVVRSRLPRIRGDAAKPDVAGGRRRGTHLHAAD